MALVGDALVGVVLGELARALLNAKKKADMYEVILQRMASTLDSIIPIVKEIEESDKVLDHPKEETEKLVKEIRQGVAVVKKCSKTNSRCSCLMKKPDYTNKLLELENSLKTFCQIVLQVQQIRDQKKILAEVKGNRAEVKAFHEEMKEARVDVKDIHEEVKGIHEEVKEVKDIHEEVKDIHEGVKEVRDIHEEVKEIHKEVKEVKDIHKEVKDIREELERLNPTASLRLCAPPEPPELTVGLDGLLKELRKELLKEGMSKIVLSAPGGCGKTTLAKKLCRDEQVEGKFKDNIFFVTVSKTPNLKVIVQQLFLHKGYRVPELQSDEDAANRLEQLLKQIGPKPTLLVLDDVWSGSECLLDKFKFKLPDYKILVTSRHTFPGFGSTYKLESLNDEDSMSLFRHSAGLEDGNSRIIDDNLVNKVVETCKGFPLAIAVVGRSLCGQPVEIWQDRVMKWSKGASIFESHVELINRLKSSLDVLDNKVVKECYMDLGSFPEGQLISATALIDIWAELYEFDEDGLNSIARLHDLSTLNLVDLVVTRKDAFAVEGYYNEHFIMQHDFLRELANHLNALDSIEQRKRLVVDISGNKFPKWWIEQKYQCLCARLLSISTDETFSSNWCNMQAPGVEVLVLNFRTRNYTLPEFMLNMDKKKALLVTNYGFFPAEISNLSLLGYLSNLRRIRLEQILIPSLSLTCVQLKNLQKISLFMCKIGQTFGNSDIQFLDALPNLVEINIGHCNNLVKLPLGLCDICHLKKLSITYCNELSMLPKEIGKLENLEVLRLRFCINLLELPETIGSLYNLSVLDISNCQSIEKFPEQIGELRNLGKLYMTGCSKCVVPRSIIKLKQLKYVICDKETAVLWKPLKRYFTNLMIGDVEV